MKTIFRKTAFALSLMTVSMASSAGEPPSAQGVPVPIPKSIAEWPDAGVPDAGTPDSGAYVKTSSGAKLGMIEAAAAPDMSSAKEKVSAAKEKVDGALKAVVKAMTPEEPTPALKNDRFSFYLTDAVAFGQYEQSAERFKLDRGRVHLGALYSEERDSVLQAGIALDTSMTESLRLSFGTRAYIALLSQENMDAFAAAIGAEAAYQLPFKALPLEFGASMYFAPDVLTFGAGDRVIDSQFDVSMPFREQSSLFAGVRYLQVDTRPADREIDNRLHLGIRWDFL